ncbi:MAG: hypothetical protein A2Y63_02940 [Candidatus Riflebacteria bacterium RBG_13_59_9]|nr:MAG: hypothetical protein A2Y63_02940 [Candidatus Riflebacteria bacterium RBG_13_59_9]
MDEREFNQLLHCFRHSIEDFPLFEATYLLGFQQKDLAQRMGISVRTLRRKLRAVRTAIAKVVAEHELAPSHELVPYPQDYPE